MAAHDFLIFEDDHLLLINKQPGDIILQDRWDADIRTLPQKLEADFGPLWVVHRLDKDTSGLILFARSEEAHKALNDQFCDHTVRKAYLCLSSGQPSWTETVCDLALRPDGDKFHRTVPDPKGKASRTEFTVREKGRGWSYLEARPLTGRTHQIRAHLTALKCPLWGDELYGGPVLKLSTIKRGYRPTGTETPLLDRAGLHAWSLEFDHPETGARVRFEAPVPKDMETALKQLRKWSPA